MKWLDKLKSEDTQIVRYGKWYAVAPAVIVLLGLIMFFILGFNLGLDFTGGSIISITDANISDSNKNEYIDRAKTYLSDYKAEYAMEKGANGNIITIKFSETDEDNIKSIITSLKGEFGENNVSESDSISASTSSEKILNVLWAVVAALAGMLIYMLFRFKFTSGMAAIIALFHDIFIMVACVIIFNVQINSSFIAALITIVGYSINNTLVLFDKVRSYEKTNTDNLTLEQILDKSLKEVLGRTMVMTVTTLVPVLVLAICSVVMGLTSLTEFTLPIIFGLIAGTYSSILVTTPLYLRFEGARLAVKKHKLKIQK
jgi:SecD/SecF fusion protein